MANRPPVDLNGEVMNGCYAHAVEYGLTVVLDIGRPHNPCWQPDAVAAAVKKYTQINFVICHLLSPQLNDGKLLENTLKKLIAPNIYFDIASLPLNLKPETYPYPTAGKYLKTAKNTVGADRLMFGSDMPSTLARDSFTHLKDYILESGVFTKKELFDVFYNTAQKVYFK